MNDAKNIRLRGAPAMARLLQQPKLISDLIFQLFQAIELEELRLCSISPGPGNDTIDGTNEALVLFCQLNGETTGIVIQHNQIGLHCAEAHRDDCGSGASVIDSGVVEPIRTLARLLVGQGYRIQNAYTRHGSHVKLVLGHASKTPDYPFGISIAFDQGSWLAGYPNPNF